MSKHQRMIEIVYARLKRKYPFEEIYKNWFYDKIREIDIGRKRNRGYFPYEAKSNDTDRSRIKALKQLKYFRSWVKTQGGVLMMAYYIIPIHADLSKILVYPLRTLKEKDFDGLEKTIKKILEGEKHG